MTPLERLDIILKQRGISRRQAAIAAKIPPSTFQSAMERRGNMSIDMLQAISNALDIPLSKILEPSLAEMMSEELERAYFYKLDDHLSNMTEADKDLFFRLSLAQAEEMARYSKEHKKTPPEAPQEAPEGE